MAGEAESEAATRATVSRPQDTRIALARCAAAGDHTVARRRGDEMADQSAAKRARMACRIYLKLYDAGPAGAPVLKEDAIGPRDDPDADLEAALAVISQFMDDTILDEPGHQGGVPHYALTAGMRDRMSEPMGAVRSLANLVRENLAKADRGEDVPAGNWHDYEVRIRTGQLDGEPL